MINVVLRAVYNNKCEDAITQAARVLGKNFSFFFAFTNQYKQFRATKKFDPIKTTDHQIYEKKTGLPTLIEWNELMF